MLRLLTFREHGSGPVRDLDSSSITTRTRYFRGCEGRQDRRCFDIVGNGEGCEIELSYYVGVDWILEDEVALAVEPKPVGGDRPTDYLRMLFSALKHPEIVPYAGDLFEIDFDSPTVRVPRRHDLLTPLLVVHFLNTLTEIVRKGLKRTYYRVEQDLVGRVKGRIDVATTVRRDVLGCRPLHTCCSYDEYGFDGPENRLLKKALSFVQRYLPVVPYLEARNFTMDSLKFIQPAFDVVSEKVSPYEVRYVKHSAIYREYNEAVRLAHHILRRFGYSIANAEQTGDVEIPPFWIDMSKLFELYVLGKLKDRFGNKVIYHFTCHGNELDYLLKDNDYKMVIDAKYKAYYKDGFNNDDIRQLSGYARLKEVEAKLDIHNSKIIDCLIIYPDQYNGNKDLLGIKLDDIEIDDYDRFFKVGIKLPMI